ncbi:MAG: Omp28-related outer membrane protein [Saprospiraceae bacterium]
MRIFTFLSLMLCLSSMAQAQVPRYVLIEHFTNTSCGPCASINPVFDANIIKPNAQVVRHIAYHPWWPSNQDPFYLYALDQNTVRTQYYAVAGVPDAVVNGNFVQSNPSSISQATVDNAWSKSSPLKVTTNWVDSGDTRDITVNLKAFGDIPPGDWRLHVVMVEREINWTVPAANGEKYFNDVVRAMFPDVNGTSILPPVKGASETFNFTYTEDTTLQLDQLAVIAFVQNQETKEVLNTGSTYDVPLNIGIETTPITVAAGTPSISQEFAVVMTNTGEIDENYRFNLLSNQPADWASEITIDDQPFGQQYDISLPAGEVLNVKVKVIPGASAYVGDYLLEINSLDNPDAPVLKSKFHVISGVTDMIINNSSALGNGAGTPALWKGLFDSGFTVAGNTTFAHTDELVFQAADLNNALTGVQNVYFNAGWSFPTLTASLSTDLKEFVQNGGNVFVCGQDVAWATFDIGTSNTYATAEGQELLKDFFGVDYVNDGAAADNKLSPNVADALYDEVAESTINAYYTATYYFPDNLKVYGTGVPIFSYNNSTNPLKVAGIRNNDPGFKTVFLAPGVEMLNAVTSDKVISITHDWFHGLISSTEFDQAVERLMTSYPNPAQSYTNIPVVNSANQQDLIITDLSGKKVSTQRIAAHSELYKLETTQFASGQYFYQFVNGKATSVAQKFQVNH